LESTEPSPGISLSSEQTSVILSEEPSLVVTAAAGAGKTRVLVERYLKHVTQDGISPDAILTITFTRKAAAEMKNRIVKELRQRRLFDEAQLAETGPIQTIHSFCERLLRENSLEAGLDPQFEILEGAAMSRLVDQCIEEALASPLEDSREAERLIGHLAGRRSYGERGSPYAVLEEAIRSVLGELRGTGLSLEELHRNQTTVEGLRTLWEQSILEHAPIEVQAAFAREPLGQPFVTRLQAAYRAAGEKAPKYVAARLDAEAESEALEHTCGLMQLACLAWMRLEAGMEREQCMDFAALEARAVRLLERSEVTRHRVARQYRMVMVDEAQDVNPMQHRLIGAMGLSCEMLVGDAQQSIYGFRQADVRLFQEKAQEAERLRLSRNFRSQPGILKFVDLVFGRLWGDGYAPMSEPPSPMDFDVIELPAFPGVELWEQPDKDTLLTGMYVKEMIDSGAAKPSEITILVRHSYYALELQESLRQNGVEARIAGGSERFYARLEIRDLANALRALGDPYDDFALLATLRSPIAGVSLDTIAMLALQSPVVEALEAFLPPVPEDEAILTGFRQWYLPLKSYADRLPAWEVLSELYATSGYLEALARRPASTQLLANVRKLLTLASGEPELGPLEYAEQIREIQELRHKEGDAPATEEDAEVVTIMTVHKSKGLEFPVVVVPEMHYPLGGRSKAVEVDPRLGLIVTKFGKKPSMFHTWLDTRRKQREAEEELRVLYVALTRAKERLCVAVHGTTRKDCLARRVASAIGYGPTPPPGFEVRTVAVDED
jgi:ATP-dependent helicase/nuclease subunit A